MSRTSTGKPVYRLAFGYPNIVVGRPDGQDMQVPLDGGDCEATLRRLADEIGTVDGQLVALLPEAEVWRGSGVSPSRVRREAATALGSRPDELAVARYPAWPASPQSFAAVRRKTLVEARAFLDRCGLEPSAITAAGAFPGFGAPPSFGRLAAVSPDARRAAVSGVGAALALLVWLAPWRSEPPATFAAADAPAAETGGLAVLTPPPTFAAAPAPAIEVATLRPAPRPARLEPVPVLPLRASAPPPKPVQPIRMTFAARNLPADLQAREPSAAAAVPAAAPPPPPRPASPDAVAAARAPAGADRPLPRPAPAAARSAAAAAPRGDGPYPRPIAARPQAADAVLVASLGAAIAVSDATVRSPRPAMADGPLARPATAAVASSNAVPVVLASLGPAAAFAAVAPPEPRRIVRAAPKPAQAKPVAAKPAPAKPVAAAQPKRVVVKPQPVAVRRQVQQPPVVVRAQPSTKKVRLQTARVQPAAAPAQKTAAVRQATAKPVRQAPVRAVAASPQPKRQAAATRQNGSARGVALIGIFGNADGRHALVQLSNGKTQRVRAGDEVQGVAVTAIASDAVHLRARGRDSVLVLPE